MPRSKTKTTAPTKMQTEYVTQHRNESVEEIVKETGLTLEQVKSVLDSLPVNLPNANAKDEYVPGLSENLFGRNADRGVTVSTPAASMQADAHAKEHKKHRPDYITTCKKPK